MPPSQLKRLKSSLREQGITGPAKSAKQKKAGNKNRIDRSRRNAALQQIRDSFNPFEIKAISARPARFPSTTLKGSRSTYRDVLHRPGVSKSAGEELRRQQLLPEMRNRNKVGGILDRRIGENDPGLTPEEKALQRYAREKGGKKGSKLFDLEASDDDQPHVGLTHFGKSLDELGDDDFGEQMSEDAGSESGELLTRKRPRPGTEDDAAGLAEDDNGPERKKRKQEVMQEVIAKSKMHKYERQKVKDDDDDLREELDKGMGEMLALLQGHKLPAPPPQTHVAVRSNGIGPTMDPDRQRLLDGMDRDKADKEYEVRLRQLAQDARAKPADRTQTEEEKAVNEARRLKELEEKRSKRMRGEEVSGDEDGGNGDEGQDDAETDQKDAVEDDPVPDDAEEFGFAGTAAQTDLSKEKATLDEEDDFALDDDLIASASDVDLSDESDTGSGSDAEERPAEDHGDEEAEFIRGILDDDVVSLANGIKLGNGARTSNVAYTYPCPRTHAELLEVVKDTPVEQLPTIIQRIRALHHPSLSATNKQLMADFSSALVDHVAYMAVQRQPLPIIEQTIRHLHSLSRTYPTEIADAFRRHLQAFHERGHPITGDLVVLTAIGNIYPTSDHFHQVVTPAITLMAKWLGLIVPDSIEKRAVGAFLVATCLDYQKLSRRYVPEAVRFTLRIFKLKPPLNVADLGPHLENLSTMAHLWKDSSAFPEIFNPFLSPLHSLGLPARKAAQQLSIQLNQSRLLRRPLELHHHRPQPIRSSIPKFEEGFNPEKHYDPDRERSDARKLQKEYKRERKGAVRELRKDANFVAREMLGEKKRRDQEYERKQRRLVAEIQGEEGREGKAYERERARRKRAR